MKYVFKNLVRDWSSEGAGERAQSYGRMLAELHARLPLREPAAADGSAAPLASGIVAPSATGGEASSPHQHQGRDGAAAALRVLVPGAGLGRLCLEVAAQVCC